MNSLWDIYGPTTDGPQTNGRTNGRQRLLRTPSGKPWVQNRKRKIDESLKIMLFRATTKTILLYVSQTWALTVSEYWNTPGFKTSKKSIRLITETTRESRLRLAGHVHRDKSSPAHMTVLWQPKHGTVARGRSATTLVDTLLKDTKQNSTAELHSLMNNHDVWSSIFGFRSSRIDRK